MASSYSDSLRRATFSFVVMLISDGDGLMFSDAFLIPPRSGMATPRPRGAVWPHVSDGHRVSTSLAVPKSAAPLDQKGRATTA